MLRLPDDLETFRTELRRAADRRIAPLAADIDRGEAFSHELWRVLRELEILAIPFPAWVGGHDGTFLAFIVALEEVSRAAAVAGYYPGTTVQVARTLLQHGSEAQIDRWVPSLVRGEALAAWAFTEPQTGSDPRQIETRAVRDGTDWVLSGQKMFISFAHVAKLAVVFAKTSDDRLGAFLVDTDDPGWKPSAPLELIAFAGSGAAPVFLDAVRVPAHQVLGAPDAGFDIMVTSETQAKVRAAAVCVGVAQRALEEATRYALQRTHRGTPIAQKFASIQGLLGEMGASVDGARALVRSVADLIDHGVPVAREAASARIVAARAARETTSNALQVCGAYGLTKDLPVERLYREGKFFEVSQGVAEIQRVIVARSVITSGGA